MRAIGRTTGAILLFWPLQPLCLWVIWTARGYCPTFHDLQLFYQPGIFLIVPVLGTAIGSLILFPLLDLLALRYAISRTRLQVTSGLLAFLVFPALSVIVLLAYAGMLPYWDWQAGVPHLYSSYLDTGLACLIIGLLLGGISPRKQTPSPN